MPLDQRSGLRALAILALFVTAGRIIGIAADVVVDDPGPALRASHWIAYAPTGYYPRESPPVIPPKASIAADLKVLHAAGFTGLVTYGSHLEAIADLAQSAGYRALVLGIWDPFDSAEKAKALRTVAAHRPLITGIAVGNEGLTTGRYAVDALCQVMSEIRAATGKPVTTTEPVDMLLSESAIGACSDFITVNAHPYFSGRKGPVEAVQWTLEAWTAVRAQYPNKLVLFKEVGLPSAGDEALSQEHQKDYYVRLAKTEVMFCYFEAFDATSRFKDGPIEQSWGLWMSDRTPKAVVRALPWAASLK